MEVVSKHSGDKGRDSLSRKLEEGTQLLYPTGNDNGQPSPFLGSITSTATIPADGGGGGNKADGKSYKHLPSIATIALADAGQQGDVTEESGGAGGEQKRNGDASRNEFAMV